MKFFTLPRLLAIAVFSIVITAPFTAGSRRIVAPFTFEARLSSTAEGRAQLYLDHGLGFTEAASLSTRLPASAGIVTLQFPLTPGQYRSFRFDPLDRSGKLSIESIRIATAQGDLIREIPREDILAAHEIDSFEIVSGRLEVNVAAGRSDPQILIRFKDGLELRETTTRRIVALGLRPLVVFLGLTVLLGILHHVPQLHALGRAGPAWVSRRPTSAVWLLAIGATLLSAYPIVFLGKSYVSPNLGTVLLYEKFPTLPGYDDATTVDVRHSDIGAIMWSHVPISMIQHRALGQGELPLWNRYNSAGAPMLGQGQSMFGDPIHLAVILAKGASWAWDLKYLLAKSLWAAGLGLLVLALTRHVGAALVIAAVSPFIGFFLYRVNHPAIFSLCYAPWPLYCWVRLAQATERRGVVFAVVALVVANLALMNSGTAKEAYMLLLCVNFSGVCLLLAMDLPWKMRLGRLAAAAWAGVVFALLTAPIWGTFLNTLRNAYTSYNAASAYQIQPSLLLGAFDEAFYRPLIPDNGVFSPSLNFALLLGVLYFLATLRLQAANRALAAIALSSLLPLSLAFGLIPPSWIVRLPFLGNVAHLDNTFSCSLIVLWTVLAGAGFAAAASRLRTREGRGDLAIAGLLLFALVFSWIAFRQAVHRPIAGPTFTVNHPGRPLPVSPFVWAYLGSVLLGSALIAGTARRAFRLGVITPTAALLLLAGATTLLWRHGLHADSVGFADYTARPTTRVDFHKKSDAVEFVRAANRVEPGRGMGVRGNFFPGWTAAYGLETVHGPDALASPFLRGLIEGSGVEFIWDWRVYVEPAKAVDAIPVLDALNVRWYLDLQSDQSIMSRGLKMLKGSDLDVYESPTAWPRAFFTDRVGKYDWVPEFVRDVRTANGKPFAAVQSTDASAVAALRDIPSHLPSRSVAPATDYRFTENTTSFTVKASGPGVVVLTETYWPGDFRADIDGVKVPILRVNHAFRGVAVPAAGEYRITFRCVPRNFPRNLVLCGVGAALGAGSLAFGLRRRPTA